MRLARDLVDALGLSRGLAGPRRARRPSGRPSDSRGASACRYRRPCQTNRRCRAAPGSAAASKLSAELRPASPPCAPQVRAAVQTSRPGPEAGPSPLSSPGRVARCASSEGGSVPTASRYSEAPVIGLFSGLPSRGRFCSTCSGAGSGGTRGGVRLSLALILVGARPKPATAAVAATSARNLVRRSKQMIHIPIPARYRALGGPSSV